MKNKIKTLAALIILISLNTILFSQAFNIDNSTFLRKGTKNVVEVYYEISRNVFQFKKVKESFRSKIRVKTSFINRDSIVSSKEFQLIDTVPDTNKIRGQAIPEIRKFKLKPGEYRVVVKITDLQNKKTYRIDKNSQVKNFSNRELELSDLTLTSLIKKTESKNKFSRYFGYDIIPNADLIFGRANHYIRSFCEVYNLQYGKNVSDKYRVKYLLKKLGTQQINQETEWQVRKKPGNTAVVLNRKGLKIDSVATGAYEFIAKLVDNETGATATSQKDVYIINKHIKNSDIVSNKNEKTKYTEAKVDSIFEPMKYLATADEKNIYKKLDNPQAKLVFIKKFWKKRDPNPKTQINEKKRSFEERLMIANRRFSTSQKQGYKTDMGRVYIEYGKPNDIIRNQFSVGKKSYQIWQYHAIEGGSKFIFIDQIGLGEYDLIHSTVRNEVKNRNWRNYIDMSGPNQQKQQQDQNLTR